MPYPAARVIADSISEMGHRLTTVEATCWRPVLAEQNTHRVFCLAGDSVLEFDLPGGGRGGRRLHKMTIADFVDRWHHGAAPRANKSHTGVNRQPMRDRLAAMSIRQINEDTGLIQHSSVVDCMFSGEKPIYQVKAGNSFIAGSGDHRIWTPEGYKTIGELRRGDEIVVRRFGKRDEDLALDRFCKIGGQWRAAWQRKQRVRLMDLYGGCQKCGSTDSPAIHHVIEVRVDPSRAFDEDNILLLCEECHKDQHRTQGWQTGHYLYGDTVVVDRIAKAGVEETFDLEIAGEFPNFIANGVVVHNSRNSASSRAIPIEKNLARFDYETFLPAEWGAERPGMQPGPPLDGDDLRDATSLWVTLNADVSDRIHDYLLAHPLKDEDGNDIPGAKRLHKSLLNRWLEVGLGQTQIITGTSWDGYFWQRCHEAADVNIRLMAQAIQDARAESEPKLLKPGEYHLPYFGANGGFEDDWDNLSLRHDVQEEDTELVDLAKQVSAGRCARVSHLNQGGKRDIGDDLRLYQRLADRSENSNDPAHASPLEHIATPWHDNSQWVTMPNRKEIGPLPRLGNFVGWFQFRHEELGF